MSFESLSSHSKPEVDRKVTDVWAAVVAVRHWRLRWMRLERKLQSGGLAFCCPAGGDGRYFSLSLSLNFCFCVNKEFNDRHMIGVLNGVGYLLRPQRLWHSGILLGNRH